MHKTDVLLEPKCLVGSLFLSQAHNISIDRDTNTLIDVHVYYLHIVHFRKVLHRLTQV